MKHIQHMTRADATRTRTTSHQLVSQDTALPRVSGPLVYKSILYEGYVLTQRLDPIDAFRVCPASRLNPTVPTVGTLVCLLAFTYWTSSLIGLTSLPLFS